MGESRAGAGAVAGSAVLGCGARRGAPASRGSPQSVLTLPGMDWRRDRTLRLPPSPRQPEHACGARGCSARRRAPARWRRGPSDVGVERGLDPRALAERGRPEPRVGRARLRPSRGRRRATPPRKAASSSSPAPDSGSAQRPRTLQHLGRQVLGLQRLAAADRGGVLDRVLQLAHVAGPVVARASARSASGETPSTVAPGPRLTCGEEVLASGAMSSRRSRSGGSSMREHAQPVVEVLAEAPLCHGAPRDRGGWRRRCGRRP